MNYKIELTPTAEAELWADFTYIHEQAPLNAQHWLEAIYKAIATLETFPSRCAVAPENQYLDDELRHLLFKSHRIIFRIDQQKEIVQILHVRHASRRAIGAPHEQSEQS